MVPDVFIDDTYLHMILGWLSRMAAPSCAGEIFQHDDTKMLSENKNLLMDY